MINLELVTTSNLQHVRYASSAPSIRTGADTKESDERLVSQGHFAIENLNGVSVLTPQITGPTIPVAMFLTNII
jgi:hypothetical protein